ncbi:hypothetical protein OSTOST_02732 [Ostertagia ostertagi]
MSLLFKKGNPLPRNPRNFRPIALLPTIYKMFISIIGQRKIIFLKTRQPVDQAGFRRAHSTDDHIHNRAMYGGTALIEKAVPLYIAFIDYLKAFDSIEHDALWKSLCCQGVHPKIVRLLSNIYESAIVNVKICGHVKPIKMRRGVRQGDPISPAL